MVNKQCSHRVPGLPVWRAGVGLAVALAVIPSTAATQDRYRVAIMENFRQEGSAEGRLLARVNAGTVVTVGTIREGWTEVTLEGWIWERSVRPSPTAGYDLAVRTSGGENLRDSPDGSVVARLLEGFLLNEVGRREGWIQVRRTGWMWGRSLRREATPDAARPGAPANEGPVTPPPDQARRLDQVSVGAGSRVHVQPEGDTLATIHRPTVGRVLARTDGWARVQTEVWVRESDLSQADDSVLVGVSAAEVRSDGRAYEGKMVRWTLQFVAMQTADELRREMAMGQRYLLTRGPMPEVGFVYVLVSPVQATALEGLAPLSYLTVVGRIHTARSRYLGNPIVELVDYELSQH